MQIPDSENTTKGDVFKYECFLAIGKYYQEKITDRIVKAIYDEAVINRKGNVDKKEFKKIAEGIVPESKIKKEVVRSLVEHFGICTDGVCINQCYLKPDEPGRGIIPGIGEDLIDKEDGEGDVEEADDNTKKENEEKELKSEGECKFCKKNFSKRAIGRHLESCEERKKANLSDTAIGKVFLIKAECDPFFVYFEANAESRLSDIDQFLRDLWLECCGHLSAFTINKVDYNSDGPGEFGGKSMEHPLSRVLKVGTIFKHEYDFGTTTVLELKCISERTGRVKDIEIIARNNMPDFKCCKCGKPAKEICSECIWENEGLLCESCVKKHKCGEDMLLPLVNSPRTGMCGYTGEY